MAWEYVHNFPDDKDDFTAPIDYPTDGWQKIISAWWQDLVTAIGAIQTYLIGGIVLDRGDPNASDFAVGDFTQDTNWYTLVLGAPEGIRFKYYHFILAYTAGGGGGSIQFRKKGNSNSFNITVINAGPGQADMSPDMWVACNADHEIEYNVTMGNFTQLDLTIRGGIQ